MMGFLQCGCWHCYFTIMGLPPGELPWISRPRQFFIAQKMDVYKINLRKAHKVKVGMTYLDNHAYISTGYQAGKQEGLIHFDNLTLEPIGGTITYTVLEW
jgi:hypothetical protein